MAEAKFIPAIPHAKLKQAAFRSIIKQIPTGKVITDRILFSFLKEACHDSLLDLDYDDMIPKVADQSTPYWRFLSTSGLVERNFGFMYADSLRTEGHVLSTNKYGRFKAEDYKQTMFDPAQFILPPAEEALIPPGTLGRSMDELSRALVTNESGKVIGVKKVY